MEEARGSGLLLCIGLGATGNKDTGVLGRAIHFIIIPTYPFNGGSAQFSTAYDAQVIGAAGLLSSH